MAAILTCATARSEERLARRGMSIYGSAHSSAQPTILLEADLLHLPIFVARLVIAGP